MSDLRTFWTNTSNSASSVVGKVNSYLGSSVTRSAASTESTDPYLTNPKYLVLITQTLKQVPTVIKGHVPKEISFSQRAKWTSPWGAGLLSSGNAGDLLALTTGNRLVAQSLSLKVWQGVSDDTSFSVEFELVAHSSTANDVMVPLQNLMKMVVPSIDANGFLKSPGAFMTAEGFKEIGQKFTEVVASATKTTVETGSKIINGSTGIVAGVQQGSAEVLKTAADSGLTRKSAIEKYMDNVIKVDIGDWFSMNNVVITDVQYTLHAQQPGPDGGLMGATVQVTFEPMFTVTAEDIPNLISATPLKPASSSMSAPRVGMK
jgi:hypothetical protein